jgi:hypothetical protein
MAKFYGTFGVNHFLKANYVAFEALDEEDANNKMHEQYGHVWSFVYTAKDFEGQPEQFGITEVPFGTPNRRLT